jgi:hypothetical protein
MTKLRQNGAMKGDMPTRAGIRQPLDRTGNTLLSSAGCQHPYRMSVATKVPSVRRCRMCGYRGPWDSFQRL